MARLPANQLQMMKLLVNTTIEQLGLRDDPARRHAPGRRGAPHARGRRLLAGGRAGRARGRRRPRRALRRLRAGTADGLMRRPARPPACAPVGVVLAGGEGRRLGGDKAVVALDGRPLLEFPLRGPAALRAATSPSWPSATPSCRRWSPRCRSGSSPTSRSTRSPASSTRCAARGAGRCSSSPVDLPLLDVALPRALARQPAGRHAAVVARAGGRLQPLLARYEPARARGAGGLRPGRPRDRPRRRPGPARPRRRGRGAAPERQPPGGPPAGVGARPRPPGLTRPVRPGAAPP